MFGIDNIVKKWKENNRFSAQGQFSVNEQVQTFLYELEKKLIRLEVSLRRVKDEPELIDQFIKLFLQIVGEIEESYTSQIEVRLRHDFSESLVDTDYASIFAELKILALQLKKHRNDPQVLQQALHRIEQDVKKLLDHQLSTIRSHEYASSY